ncbi:hypothetical protein [Paenirhodobacter sp.]|uniref:hypothetical protein n=1 Tax=Paenirhodobacter sp. TaxID=1965326 RepID=UPI003B5144EB
MTIPIRTEPHPCRSVPQRVVHLVDDDSWGGVTRGLGFIAREPRHAQQATPQVVAVPRGSLRAPEIVADAIVSHLTISGAACRCSPPCAPATRISPSPMSSTAIAKASWPEM